ncbi:DUF397 domain-containing protein [Actinoplanes sp. NPDC023936]|uniref:DUF397 domain-containing protein n=1 Tax=Actinoplanes sp. NPDC023936 TaxID=3154910 RepID=UPI0033EE71B6
MIESQHQLPFGNGCRVDAHVHECEWRIWMVRLAEPTRQWTRSTFCADNACVEVAPTRGGNVLVRDSKNPEQPFLKFSKDDWSIFLDRIRDGRYGSLDPSLS